MGHFQRMRYNKYTSKNNREFSVEDIKTDKQCLRLFLSLHFNDFQFEKDLVELYNLTKGQIQKYSEKLSGLGFVSFRRFSELDENMQEAIMKFTPDADKFYKQNQKAYIITPLGKTQGKGILQGALEESRTNQALYDLINQISIKTKLYRSTKQKIVAKEKMFGSREIKLPNGITFVRNTMLKQQLLKSMALKRLNVRSGNSLVLKDMSNNLVLQSEIKQEVLKMEQKEYTGMYSHLTQAELIAKSYDEVSKSDLASVRKEYRDEAKHNLANMKKEDLEFQALRFGGSNLCPAEKDYLHREAESFLESLK